MMAEDEEMRRTKEVKSRVSLVFVSPLFTILANCTDVDKL